jgi:hypothetical protein
VSWNLYLIVRWPRDESFNKMTAWRRASTLSFAADLAMLRFNGVIEKQKRASRVASGGLIAAIRCDPSLKSMT